MNNQSTDTRVIVTAGVVKIENPKRKPSESDFYIRHSEGVNLGEHLSKVYKEFADQHPPFHTSPEVKDGPYLLSEFGDEVWQFQTRASEGKEWVNASADVYVKYKFQEFADYMFNDWDAATRRFRPFIGKSKEQVEQETDKLTGLSEYVNVYVDGKYDNPVYDKIFKDGAFLGAQWQSELPSTSPASFKAGVSVGRVEGEAETSGVDASDWHDHYHQCDCPKCVKPISAEDWLKENCKTEDYDKLHDNLKDFMSTTNVCDYMEVFSSSQPLIDKLTADNKAFREAIYTADLRLDGVTAEDIPSFARLCEAIDILKQALKTK